MTHSLGQKVVRFYDLDSNLIEPSCPDRLSRIGERGVDGLDPGSGGLRVRETLIRRIIRMPGKTIFEMKVSEVYPLLVRKAERKGRSRAEVDRVTEWLTGYDLASADLNETYAEFFDRAPAMNPRASLIRGSVCGVKVEEIEDPLMQKIRWLDKLVDELAKGKPMDKILR